MTEADLPALRDRCRDAIAEVLPDPRARYDEPTPAPAATLSYGSATT